MSNISRPGSRAGSMIPVPVGRTTVEGAASAPGPQWEKHAALASELEFTPEECRNVNERIKKTADIVLSQDNAIRGPGPGTYAFSANLGVALVAEIAVRPIQRPCSLADPVLRDKILAMAGDPTHERFRHTYLNGKVWFYFRVTNPVVARRRMAEE